MKRALAAEIEKLYQLPLAEFTSARNALARSLEGRERKDVASLVKPSLPMWVINQLYWRDAPTYNALVDAAEKLRAAHRAAVTGRDVDTRQADRLHRTTVEKAFGKSIALAEAKGVRVTDAVRETVRRTLTALPGEEPPGRLTRPPEPAGFSLLTGIKPRPAVRSAVKRDAREAEKAQARARREEERAQKEREKREQKIRKAEQALRDAERRLAALKR